MGDDWDTYVLYCEALPTDAEVPSFKGWRDVQNARAALAARLKEWNDLVQLTPIEPGKLKELLQPGAVQLRSRFFKTP